MAGQETCLVAGARQVAKPAANQPWSQSPVKEENHRKNRKRTEREQTPKETEREQKENKHTQSPAPLIS